MNAELVTEFAKEKCWENNTEVFKPDNQCYLFGEQFYRLNRLRDKVSVIVTDSPLPLNIIYNKGTVLREPFNQTVMDCFDSFYNLSYLVIRDKHYNPAGRRQNEAESERIQEAIFDLMDSKDIPYKIVKGNQNDYDLIVDEVLVVLKGDANNMKIFDLKRGGGKSTRMLYASEYHNAPIICVTDVQKDSLKSKAKELGLDIPEPICIGDIGDARTSLNTTDVLVDEMPLVLQRLLSRYGSYHIVGGTLTSDEGGLYDRG